jgi:hypothetical protein
MWAIPITVTSDLEPVAVFVFNSDMSQNNYIFLWRTPEEKEFRCNFSEQSQGYCYPV